MYSHHSKGGTNTADVPERDVGDILLEEGDWRLRKARFPSVNGVDSFPVHMCGRSPEGYGVHRKDTDNSNPRISIVDQGLPPLHERRGTCVKCGEKAPDSIMGLWTLHNWDVATR